MMNWSDNLPMTKRNWWKTVDHCHLDKMENHDISILDNRLGSFGEI